jgi:hypothetical protein
MAKEIYSQEVFENQQNGTIFQTQGRLNDFPYISDGVFESWRYSFEAGKQVFRASSSGKVFEKRVIKDIHGNPQWTAWVEIPDAEAHGIQAIAVNDRPLQLPNTDGAIKLQITPQMINAYTKSETYDLVKTKIEDEMGRAYEYVPWQSEDNGSPAISSYRTLQLAKDRGLIISEKDQYYIVEPQPGTTNPAAFFIWDIYNNKEDWISVDIPNMTLFVSFDQFTALSGQVSGYRVDYEVVSGIVSGLVYDESIIDQDFARVNQRVDDHLADIGSDVSPHITPAERENWNEATEYLIPIPRDSKRYIVENGEYMPAYEQYAIDKDALRRDAIIPFSDFTGKNDYLVANDLMVKFNAIRNNNNFIDKVRLEFDNLATYGSIIYLEAVDTEEVPDTFTGTLSSSGFTLEGEVAGDNFTGRVFDSTNSVIFNFKGFIHGTTLRGTVIESGDSINGSIDTSTTPWTITGRIPQGVVSTGEDFTGEVETKTNLISVAKSPEWKTSSGGQIWEIEDKVFDEIVVRTDKPGQMITLRNLKAWVYYTPRTKLNIGDQDDDPRLQLNLRGSGILFYNDKPIFDEVSGLGTTAEWGLISGDINQQGDLKVLLAEFFKDKVSNADKTSNLRYDVYKDAIIPSLIQQPTNDTRIETFNIGDIGKDSTGVSGIGILRVDTIPVKLDGTNVVNVQGAHIITGISGMLKASRDAGFVPIKADLDIEYIASYYKDVFFATDNPNIPVSTKIGSSAFTYDWPGQLNEHYSYDTIYICGDDNDGNNHVAEYLDRVKLNVMSIQYNDWVLQSTGYDTLSGHRGTINAVDLNINVLGNGSGLFSLDALSEKKKIAGTSDTEIGDNTTLGISGLFDIETLGTRFNSSGFLDLTSDKIHIDSRSGYFDILSQGAKIDAQDAAITIRSTSGIMSLFYDANSVQSAKNIVEDAGKDFIVRAKENVRLSGHDARIETEDLTAISGHRIKLNASGTIGIEIDTEYSDYDPTRFVSGIGNVVKIHGEEADERYAHRDLYEATSGAVSGEIYDREQAVSGLDFKKVDKDLVGNNKIVQDVTFVYYSDSGYLDWKKNLVSLHDGTQEEWSGRVDIASQDELDTIARALGSEVQTRTREVVAANSSRISGDLWLSGLIDSVSGVFDPLKYLEKDFLHKTPYGTDYIVQDIHFDPATMIVSSRLVNPMDPTAPVISGTNYFETDLSPIFATIASNTDRITKVEQAVSGIVEQDTENYDLVIHSDAELDDALANGTFEAAERILIDSSVTGSIWAGTIDLTKVRYIHGEENGKTISLTNVTFADTYHETYLDTITLIGKDQQLSSEERKAREYLDISGPTTIDLTKYYDIYQFGLSGLVGVPCEVTFDNVIEGKEYIFYIDQPTTDIIDFSIGNSMYNADNDLSVNLENQEKGLRTVIKAIGSNSPVINGLIITEVITGIGDKAADGVIVTIGNTKANLYDTAKGQDDCVNKTTIRGQGTYKVGSTISVRADRSNTGWKDIVASVFNETTGTQIVADTPVPFTFTAPGSTVAGTRDILRIDFNATPELFDVELTPNVRTASSSGFTTYQIFYDEVTLNISAIADYYLHRVTDSEGSIYVPIVGGDVTNWKFKVPVVPAGNKLTVTSAYYLKMTGISHIESPDNPSPDKTYFIAGKENTVEFFCTPAYSFGDPEQDPIQIVAYNGVPILPGTMPPEIINWDENRNDLFTIKPPNGETLVSITVRTGSGSIYTTLTLPIKDVIFTVGSLEADDTEYPLTIYKGGNADEVRGFHVVWDGGIIPTDTSGTWTLLGSSGASVPVSNADKADVTVLANQGTGDFILEFVPTMNPGLTFRSHSIHIHQLPDYVDITGVTTAKTDDNLSFGLVWTPLADNLIDNTKGTWTSSDNTRISGLDNNGNFKVLKKIGGPVTLTFKSNSNSFDYTTHKPTGPSVWNIHDITAISASDYYLGFTSSDPHYRGTVLSDGISNIDNTADTLIAGHMVFEHGYTISDTTSGLIMTLGGTAGPDGRVSGVVNSYAEFSFTMPFGDTIIDITSKPVV